MFKIFKEEIELEGKKIILETGKIARQAYGAIIAKCGDTVVISIDKTNRLEKYVTPDFRFILPDILDTVPPKISLEKFIKDKLIISFSEPVQHWKNINEISLENSTGYSIKGFNEQDTVFLDNYFQIGLYLIVCQNQQLHQVVDPWPLFVPFL